MSGEPDDIAANTSFGDTYDDHLYGAIGRVAVASAMLDEVLTELLDDLAGTDIFWRITIGQSTDWLIQSLRILLDETDPNFSTYTKERHERFGALLDEAGRLRDLRNFVIHGLFTPESAFEEDARPRPWGQTEGSESILYVDRGRTRKGYVSQAITQADLLSLASRLARTRDDLVRLHREMMRTRHPDRGDWLPPPLARWVRDRS